MKKEGIANLSPIIALYDPMPILAEDVRKRIKEFEDEAEKEDRFVLGNPTRWGSLVND